MRHLVAAAILASMFAVARSARLRHQDDYRGDEYGVLQAAAWAGVYVMLNLRLGWQAERLGVFYWGTYVMTWALPAAGLYLGLRGKDRPLIDVSLAMCLVTLLTNKPYLGWPQHTWDPMLLGVFLAVVALALWRWLEKGRNGERAGFTAARLHDDSAVLTILRATAATIQPDARVSRGDPAREDFDGGRSGGAGGGATY
jgi:hypothetical protein